MLSGERFVLPNPDTRGSLQILDQLTLNKCPRILLILADVASDTLDQKPPTSNPIQRWAPFFGVRMCLFGCLSFYCCVTVCVCALSNDLKSIGPEVYLKVHIHDGFYT